MRFAGLALDDAVLDAKTIWLYREPLARSGAAETLVTRFEALLREKGWLAMGGQIIDATVIEARRPRLTQTEKDTIKGGGTPGEWTPARRAQTDRDGRSTIKRGKKREVAPGAGHKRQTEIAVPAFGYENHIGIDREYGFLRRYTVTMPRLTMAVSSAPCSIATTPQARCGPTPPTPRRPTWHSSSARDSRLNSIAKSRAASRCRCTSPVAMPPAPWYARASNTSLPPKNAGSISSCAVCLTRARGSRSVWPTLPIISLGWLGLRRKQQPHAAPATGWISKHQLLANALAISRGSPITALITSLKPGP